MAVNCPTTATPTTPTKPTWTATAQQATVQNGTPAQNPSSSFQSPSSSMPPNWQQEIRLAVQAAMMTMMDTVDEEKTPTASGKMMTVKVQAMTTEDATMAPLDSGASNVVNDENEKKEGGRRVVLKLATGQTMGLLNKHNEVHAPGSRRLMSMGRTVEILGATVAWKRGCCMLTLPSGVRMRLTVIDFVPHLTAIQFEQLRGLLRRHRRDLFARFLATLSNYDVNTSRQMTQLRDLAAMHGRTVRVTDDEANDDDTKEHLDDEVEQDEETKKMTEILQQRDDHESDGHHPYDKRCPSCLTASARGKQHRSRTAKAKWSTGELSIDVTGPHKGLHAYALVGHFRPCDDDKTDVITTKKADDETDGATTEEADEQTVVAMSQEIDEKTKKDETTDDEAIKQSPKDNFGSSDRSKTSTPPYRIFVLPLMDKSAASVLAGVQEMVNRVRAGGGSVTALHGDAGVMPRSVRNWAVANHLFPSTSIAYKPATNGRAERAIGIAKEGARRLLTAGAVSSRMWSMALRHWCFLQGCPVEVRRTLPVLAQE